MADYSWLKIGVRADTSEMENQIKRSALGAGNTASQSFSTRFGSGLKKFGKVAGVAALGATVYGAGKAFGFVKDSVIDYNSQMEQATIAFTTMLGSADKAHTFLGQLQDFAAKTPFEMSGLTQSAQQLMGMGIAAKDVIPTLTAIGDSVASVGGDQEELNRTQLAWGQIVSKGTVSMDNMNQLLQGGIPNALKILADHYNVTTGELVKMISAGDVTAKEAMPALAKGIEQGTDSTAALGGMMDKQSRTFSGAMSNISDSLTQNIAKMGRPLFKQISGWTNQLAGWLSSPQFTKFGKRLTTTISRAFRDVGPAIGSAVQTWWKYFQPILGPLWTFIKLVGTLLFRAIQTVAPMIKVGLAGAFIVWKVVLDSVNAILGPIVGWFSNPIFRMMAGILAGIAAAWWLINSGMYANPIGIIVVAIVGLIVIIGQLIKHWRDIWGAIKSVASAIWERALKPVFDALKGAFQTVWNTIKNVWNRIWPFLKTWGPVALAVIAPFIGIPLLIFQHWHQIVGFLKKVWNIVWPFLKKWGPVALAVLVPFIGIPLLIWQHFDKIVGWLKRVWNNVVAGFRWLWKKGFLPIWNGIKGAFQAAWNWIKKYVWTPFQNVIHTVAAVFKAFWHRTIAPVWDGIKSAFKAAWGFIKRNIFDPIHNAVNKLGDVFRWLWHKVISPVWDGIKAAIQWPWKHIIQPIMQTFHDWPAKLKKVWDSFKTAIGKIFNLIKKAVGTPIYYVASKILKPIINGINWLISKIGIPKIPVEWIEKIPHFAEGGRVPGKATGPGDNQLAWVRSGEWVLTERQSKAIGYGNLARLPHYAEGGLVGGGAGDGGAGFVPPSTFSLWSAIGGVVSSVSSAISGVVHKIGDVIVRSAKDLYKLGVSVLKAAAHLLRYAAAQAFKAAMAPLVKLLTPLAKTPVPPGNVLRKTFGMMVLQVIDKAIAFIEGHSESDSAESMAGMIAQKAVDVATKQIGKPYVFTAHGPNSFDCSGLVEYAYRMAGFPDGKIPGPRNAIGGTTYTQVKHGKEVNQNSALPGDLVFYFGHTGPQPHHVAIASSPHEVIQAPDVGMNVMRSAPFSAAGMRGDRIMVRRLVKEIAGGVDLGQISANAKSVWKGLRQLGWGKIQAAGALGSMQYEDSSFNPFIIQGGGTSRNPMAAGGGGYGIVQWTPGSKLADILRWGGKANNLGNQLWALDQQLKGRSPHPEGRAGRLLRNATNPYQAGLIFANEYERMGTDTAAGRATSARAYYERLHEYDTGGWLPPGTTLVQNMTRKPEPVLTNRQWDALTAGRGGGGSHYIAGGSLDIGIDSQGRMRAWVQDMILDEADYGGSVDRRGGGGW